MSHTNPPTDRQALVFQALKIVVIAPFVVLWWAWLAAIAGLFIAGPFLILGWLFG